MASSAAPASTSILNSLPPRPPTPPREANHDADVSDVSLPSLGLGRPQPFDPRPSLQTPPGSHSPASSHPSSVRARKKVEWSSHTEYKDPPQYSDGPRLDCLPLSAPPSASSKPLKGILKHSPSPSWPVSALGGQLHGAAAQPNISEMLDSTIKQLAGPDRDSRLDAYLMLARALKASNNLPDRVALQNKMSLFMQFIQRDVRSKKPGGALDSSLINHALTLLATFLHFPAIASTLTSDFGLFVVDHAIRSFEDESVPKDVVRHLMQVIAFQNFSPKVMTPDRVCRLVAALHKIDHHLKGKSIVMSRLHIYKRLVKQARGSMLTHSDWLQDMFTDMLSTVKDIRAQAISLGTESGFALRHDKVLFRKVAEIFKATSDDETYIEFYIKRLELMTKDKQTCSAVPQIWSVVILFLRCPLDRWQHYGPWLTLVQSAFNMTDCPTKQEANYAWNRYVYLSIVDSKMASKGIATLCQPLLSQLRRKTNPKQQEEAMKLRRVVVGGVCNLYYHALAQGDDKYPTQTIWDVAIQPVMEQLINLDAKPDYPGDCMLQAARMLIGLLDVSTPRPPRNPERIMDAAPLVPEELLPIDCKWVRRNCHKVLQAVGPILEKRFVDLADKESLAFRLWQALVGSVAAASAKDIKVSEDTARFLACSFNLLSKVWSAGLDGSDSGSTNTKFLVSVKHFVNSLTDGLRVLPFTEKKLSLSVSNTFETVSTPSPRLNKNESPRGLLRTPLQHLFAMLCSTPPGCVDDEELASLFQSAFEPFVKGRSAKGGAELSRELIQLLPRNALSPFGPWLLAAEYTKTSLDNGITGSGSSGSSGDKILGPQYREVVSLLERGLVCHPNLPAAHWQSLFDLVSATVAQEVGDAGRALVVIEPLAKALLDNFPSGLAKPSTIFSQAMKTLFQVAKLPRDRQALDAARLRLWGSPPAAAKAGSSDPFDNLYKLGNHAMELFYDKYTDLDAPAEVDAFAEAVGLFLERCLSQSMVWTISKMQRGLCPWIRDERIRLQLHDESSISKTLRQLWDRVCNELASHGRLEKDELVQIEPLLTAAFESKHAHIVSKAAAAWNALFKDEDGAECSDGFLSVISSFRSRTDLILPGPADPPSGGFGAQAFSLVGHPDDESLALSSPTSRRDSNQATAPAAPVSKRPATRKRRMETTAEARENPAKRTSISRPRHDDSQIQFAAIAPSSSPRDESQHLTDRQKEVRERQRESSALFPGLRSSSPCFAGAAKKKGKSAEDGGAECLENDRTPKHKSYDDLIRSTPTPRRGQLLPVDELNDPPSSPPVPRPYPLLSEIQSRSRASNSLENWEFSSPTGSPVARPRQASRDGEPVPFVLREEPSQAKGRVPTGNKRRSADIKEQETAKVIPSSITDDDGSVAYGQTEDSAVSPAPAEPPTTPPPRRVVPTSEMRETPKSGEDEFVDARSSPERSPRRRGQIFGDAHSGDAAKETSFALSEGDESRMVELVAELESRRYGLPIIKEDSRRERKSESEEQESDRRTGIQAVSPSPMGPITRRESKRLASLVRRCTSVEAADGEAEGKAKRKRKRSGAKHGGDWGKRRRRAESEVERRADNRLKTEPSAPKRSQGTRQGSGLPTRGDSRKQNQGTADAVDSEGAGSPEGKESVMEEASPGADIGDTDEEVMSQLVTESFAAASQQCQSQQSAEAGAGAPGRATAKGLARVREHADARLASKASAEAGGEQASGRGDKRPGIVETLRGGLEQLCKAALSRDEVYELEDILMDMRRELYEAERRGRRRQRA